MRHKSKTETLITKLETLRELIGIHHGFISCSIGIVVGMFFTYKYPTLPSPFVFNSLVTILILICIILIVHYVYTKNRIKNTKKELFKHIYGK